MGYKLLDVVKSDKPGKKLKAVFKNDDTGRNKTVHFGDSTMDDYTLTKDKEQRSRYRSRHAKDLDTGDPTRAGYLSYYLLWGDSTSVAKNVAAYRNKFHL
jgi:hypothetical protein